MDNVVNVIHSNPSIENLEICNSRIKLEGMKLLAEEIKTNATLKHLALINVGMTREIADVLADALIHNTTLCSLKINEADLDGSSIFGIFVRNNTLQDFDCSSTDITNSDLDYLASSLEHNTSLKRLDLSYNNVKSSKIIMVLLRGSAITNINTDITRYDDNYEVINEIIKMRMRRQHQQETDSDSLDDY